MSVSSNALTLAQYAIMSNDPLVQGVTYSLLENASVLSDLPLVTRPALKAAGVRWQNSLPPVNWRALNSEPTVTSGTPTPFEEQAFAVSNAIDVDRLLVLDQGQIVDPRAAQIDAYMKSVNYDINFKFLKNDHVTGDANAPVGLRYRLDNPTDFGSLSELKINGGGVDMSQGGMTSTTANNFIEVVEQLLSYLGAPEGNNVTLYMNDTMKRRFARAVRTLGGGAGFNTTQDAFGRSVDTYRAARVVDLGRKSDQSTRIITETETAAGVDGASTFTSIYGVRYGDNGLIGWQMEPLIARDAGLVGNAGTIYRTVIDWAFGLYPQNTRSFGRIYNIKLS